MSFQILAKPKTMAPLFEAELVNKFSKYIKTIRNRVVEGLK